MTSSSPIKKRSARRCLFGRPDHKAFSEELKCDLQKMKEEQSKKWGFDFELCAPLPSSSSPFKYIVIDPATIPEYYRTKTIATPIKRSLDENKSPEISPIASDISMDCSMGSPRTKNSPGKKRRTDQRRITDVFPTKRKHLQSSPSKRVAPVVPSPPTSPLLVFPSI